MTDAGIALLDAWRVPEARTFFLNVWPMYVHELSGFDSEFYRLDPSGKWLPDIADDWVAAETPAINLRAAPPERASHPFQRSHVIVLNDAPIGFACVGLAPFKYMPENAEVTLAEFFLANPFRGSGAARRAFEALLPLYGGRWHLRALRDNLRAIRFWRRTLPSMPIQDLVESSEERDVSWCFAMPPTNLPLPGTEG